MTVGSIEEQMCRRSRNFVASARGPEPYTLPHDGVPSGIVPLGGGDGLTGSMPVGVVEDGVAADSLSMGSRDRHRAPLAEPVSGPVEMDDAQAWKILAKRGVERCAPRR